jgi:hypothetical protein
MVNFITMVYDIYLSHNKQRNRNSLDKKIKIYLFLKRLQLIFDNRIDNLTFHPNQGDFDGNCKMATL